MEINSPRMSVTVQQLAFSCGYVWENTGKSNGMEDQYASFLIFNPDDKTIQWCEYRKNVEKRVSQIVRSYDELISLLTNPPGQVFKVGNVKVGHNGDVVVSEIITLTSAMFDKFVEGRNKFLGRTVEKVVKPVVVKKVKLAKVRFLYNNKKSSDIRYRTVLVTVYNIDSSIEGLDVDDNFQYKRFLESNIKGSIHFLGYEDEPVK